MVNSVYTLYRCSVCGLTKNICNADGSPLPEIIRCLDCRALEFKPFKGFDEVVKNV